MAGQAQRLEDRRMYEDQFGLKKRPFGSQTAGADVFIGPQTAGLVTRAKKVFAEPDAVVCVNGPVGSGKTTVVARSLSALGRQHTVIRIGRIKLGPDEVIEFLLRELGLKQMPAGTIQKLTVFRSLLKKFSENDIRLFVVVEDATRLGNTALAELEALTATDAGVSDGANLVLMSEDSLKNTFRAPGLARLKQRARLHYELKALTAPEVRGYLTHGLRQAGGDISAIIDDDAVLAVHALSEGIPRVINNLVNSALEAVAEKDLSRLDTAHLADVAASEYGLEVENLDAVLADSRVKAPAPSNTAPPEEQQEEPAAPEAPASDPVEDPADNPVATSEPETPPADEPAADVPDLIQDTLPEVEALSSGEYPIPDLIQDTLPDLEVLSPGLAEAASSEARAQTEESEAPSEPKPPLIQDTVDDLPVLDNSPELQAQADRTPAIDDLPGVDDLPDVDDLAFADGIQAQAPEDDIPTLFDSSPGMSSPAVEKASAVEAAPEPAADPSPAPALAAQAPEPAVAAPPPEPAVAATPVAESPAPVEKEVPAWDRDPTMAELKPDLDALEHAMAIAQGIPENSDSDEPEIEDASEEVPEITLDDSIRRKIDIAEVALQATESLDIDIDPEDSVSVPALDIPDETGAEKQPTRADDELERIAAELSRAKTIEDVDDRMAETLFGEEINMIAAEFAANAPDAAPEPAVEAPAADEPELSLMATSSGLEAPVPEPSPATQETDLEKEFKEVYGDDAIEVSIESDQSSGGMDLSASQRLATVRALNAGSMPATPPPSSNPAKRPPGPAPDSIEDQINTSITQTLKTLKAKQAQPVEEPEEEEKSGFFSRFRKS